MVEDRGPQLAAVCITFITTAVVATALRCYTRLCLMKSAWGIEDWLMVSATLTFIMFTTCSVSGVRYGTGRHFSDLSPYEGYMAMRYWWLCYVSYGLTMIAVKLSIGLLLLRLTVNVIQIRIIKITMLISTLVCIVFFFVTMFQCNPISYFWNRSQSGSCISVEVLIALSYLYSAVGTINDFTLGLMPIALVYKLQMDTKTKVLLAPVLSLGCIASAAILVRMAYVQEFANPDFLWATVDIAIWSDIEQGLAITAGSLATLRPLFKVVGDRLGFHSTQPLHDRSDERQYSSRVKRRTPGPLSLASLAYNANDSQHSTTDSRVEDIKYSEGHDGDIGTAITTPTTGGDALEGFEMCGTEAKGIATKRDQIERDREVV